MKVFVLLATGKMACFPETRHTILHGKAYHTQEKAAEQMAPFLSKCIKAKNEYDITYLLMDSAKVNVVELELEE